MMINFAELSDFIVSLSENPAKAREFKETPERVMTDSGLSDDTKAVLMSEPLNFLREVFLAATPKKPVVQTQVNTQTNVYTDVHVTTTTNVNKHTNVAVVLVP